MIENIKKVACVGGGVIGASWAVNFATKGYAVTISTTRQETLDDARHKIENFIETLRAKNILTDDGAKAALEQVSYTTDIGEAAQNAGFIQENLPDSIELKQKVLAQIEAACPKDAIISSSTSNLLITDIAAKASNPDRIVGGHPYNPPHLIPLVEISKGKYTTQDTVDRAVEFYRSCGKSPAVLNKESIGFIANRLQMALYREAVDLVTRGVCDVSAIDAAVTYGPGMRWSALGPNMLYQLGGGKGGLKGLLTALKTGGDALIADLADWKIQPQEWPGVAQAGVDEEMANMPDFIGHTNEDIAAFRDNILIELLKLHQKF